MATDRELGMHGRIHRRDFLNGIAVGTTAWGFVPASDIAAITVNRWPHGYAYEYNDLCDAERPEGECPFEIARRPFGRIAIANPDAAAAAYCHRAIDQAYSAEQEVLAT